MTLNVKNIRMNIPKSQGEVLVYECPEDKIAKLVTGNHWDSFGACAIDIFGMNGSTVEVGSMRHTVNSGSSHRYKKYYFGYTPENMLQFIKNSSPDLDVSALDKCTSVFHGNGYLRLFPVHEDVILFPGEKISVRTVSRQKLKVNIKVLEEDLL